MPSALLGMPTGGAATDAADFEDLVSGVGSFGV